VRTEINLKWVGNRDIIAKQSCFCANAKTKMQRLSFFSVVYGGLEANACVAYLHAPLCIKIKKNLFPRPRHSPHMQHSAVTMIGATTTDCLVAAPKDN
jgi:hypothetical protein